MSWKVPFFDLNLDNDDKRAVMAVMESNWLTAGPMTEKFEEEFACAVKGDVKAAALSSATAALHLSLLALGIGPGDEVIVPSLTFVACANVIRYVGADPVFADISGQDDWCISYNDTLSKITEKTRAIIIVHYAGYPCETSSFSALCREKGIYLIEDCSHAPPSGYGDSNIGSIGDTACYSFYSNKNMTTGEGGMLVSKDVEIVQNVISLRSHGITSPTYQRFKGHVHGYDVVGLGYNYRIDEMRAALGLAQLKKLYLLAKNRARLASLYRRCIADSEINIQIPFKDKEKCGENHIFPVLLPDHANERAEVVKRMAEYGIQCSVHYQPIHSFTGYERYNAAVPITEQIAPYILSLPLFPSMTEQQVHYVVEKLAVCL